MINHTFEHGMYIRHVEAAQPKGIIVYIHGLGGSGYCFEQLINRAELHNWDHLVPDLPSYGKSPWTQTPLTLQEYVEHLIIWLRNRRTTKAIILGHSMGAVIGLMLCEKNLDLVRAFINIEGNVSLDDCTFSSKTLEYTLQGFIDHGMDTLCDSVYQEGLSNPAMRRYYPSLRMCNPASYHLNGGELVQISQTETLATRQGKLKIPHMYILGNPRGTGMHSQSLLTSSGVPWIAIDRAGHWPFIDQIDSFDDELLKFLARLPT